MGGAAGRARVGFTTPCGGGYLDDIWRGRQSAVMSSSACCCGVGAWGRFCTLFQCSFASRDVHFTAAYGRFHEPTTYVTGHVSQHCVDCQHGSGVELLRVGVAPQPATANREHVLKRI